VTTQLVVLEVQVAPPGAAVTVYPVTGAPPVTCGAIHDTATWLLPGVTCTQTGALLTPTGVTMVDVVGDDVVPAAVSATTEKETGTPFVRPTTVHDVVVEVH
jgi:hypothetical protein